MDFQKAFDSVNRPILWNVIRKLGIKGKLYNTLHKMYNAVKACVRCNGTLTDYITCPVGLKQENKDGTLKTKFENLVCKISQKELKLEPSYLVHLLGLRSR